MVKRYGNDDMLTMSAAHELFRKLAALMPSSPGSTDVLLSAALTQSKQWEAGVEFVCAHCGGRSLRIVKVAEKVVRVECLSCSKESAIQRGADSIERVNPPSKS
jgi:hypothetical protein